MVMDVAWGAAGATGGGRAEGPFTWKSASPRRSAPRNRHRGRFIGIAGGGSVDTQSLGSCRRCAGAARALCGEATEERPSIPSRGCQHRASSGGLQLAYCELEHVRDRASPREPCHRPTNVWTALGCEAGPIEGDGRERGSRLCPQSSWKAQRERPLKVDGVASRATARHHDDGGRDHAP